MVEAESPTVTKIRLFAQKASIATLIKVIEVLSAELERKTNA
jgi:hypothetical protein